VVLRAVRDQLTDHDHEIVSRPCLPCTCKHDVAAIKNETCPMLCCTSVHLSERLPTPSLWDSWVIKADRILSWHNSKIRGVVSAPAHPRQSHLRLGFPCAGQPGERTAGGTPYSRRCTGSSRPLFACTGHGISGCLVLIQDACCSSEPMSSSSCAGAKLGLVAGTGPEDPCQPVSPIPSARRNACSYLIS